MVGKRSIVSFHRVDVCLVQIEMQMRLFTGKEPDSAPRRYREFRKEKDFLEILAN